MITLTQLEYIVAIDEYRHFATAAEKCLKMSWESSFSTVRDNL